MTSNAVELGSSAPALASLAKSLGLPLPRPGHWSKKAVGKAPPTPDYSADAKLDGRSYPVPPPITRLSVRSAPHQEVHQDTPAAEQSREGTGFVQSPMPASEDAAVAEPEITAGEHKKVGGTRSALRKSRSTDRVSIGGRGKFRLLITPIAGERGCAILDRLLAAVEAKGWSIDNDDQGFAISAEGETIGFLIEEQLDRVPHVVTPAEVKEKADYDRKCALADRGIGYRPWRPPAIPDYDHVPNGELTLKFDHNYDAGGTRRTFSDGKRQRLENLLPSVLDSIERWCAAVKAKREEREEQKRQWAEQDRRRKQLENQARVEGYRIAFLQRQIERKREIDGLTGLIETWEGVGNGDPKFEELLEFARLYRKWLGDKIAPAAVAERITALKLMDDDVYIYDAKRLD